MTEVYVEEDTAEYDVCCKIRELVTTETLTIDQASTVTGVAKRSIVNIACFDCRGFTLFELQQMLKRIEAVV